MAYVFQDGFETGDFINWTTVTDAGVVAAKTGMSGSYCGYVGNVVGLNGYIRKDITVGAELYGSFLYWADFAVVQGCCFSIFTGVDWQIRAIVTDTGAIRVDRYAVTIATSSPGIVSTQTTTKIDFYVSLADTGGRVVIYVDDDPHTGTPAIDFTGDTRYVIGNIDNFRLGCTTGVYAKGFYDNVALDDADYPTFGVIPRTTGPLPMYRRGFPGA